MNDVSSTVDNCLLCQTRVYDAIWKYRWQEKDGYCCNNCGKMIHMLGNNALNLLESMLTFNGLSVKDYKEKFGMYRLTCYAKNGQQVQYAEKSFTLIRSLLPELTFLFKVWKILDFAGE